MTSSRARSVRSLVRMLSLAPLALCATAAIAGSGAIDVTINGSSVVSETSKFQGGSTGYLRSNPVGSNYTGSVEAGVSAAAAGALATISGTVVGLARATATSTSDFTLRAPAAVPSIGGGRFVLYFRLDGEIVNHAKLDAVANVEMDNGSVDLKASAQRSLTDQPGRESIEFDVTVPLPVPYSTDDFILVYPTLAVTATASIPGGVTQQTATADARNGFTAIGFRVFAASGAQVTGFTARGSRAIPELAPPPVGLARAIEYYNPQYASYFITSIAAEIADLDSGRTVGWQRTGEAFNVYAAAAAGLAGVCRFYGVFPPKSSHFYAPRGLGCEALLPANPVWQYEGDVFYTFLPNNQGGCPAGNVPVYRLYNNGQGGAPNHRFTTNQSIQLQMLAAGWIAEGTGAGVGMCSPQ